MNVKSETDQYEWECDLCFEWTDYRKLQWHNDRRLCPDCFDEVVFPFDN